MNTQELVMLAMQASIMITVFSFGLEATVGDVLHLFRRPALLARSLVAMFIVMPAVAVVMTLFFNLPKPVEIALVALSVSPIPPLLPKKQGNAGGDTSYAIGLLVTMAVLSVVVIPLALWVLGRIFDRPLTVHPFAVAWIVVKAAVVPILLGMVFRTALPELAARLVRPARLVGGVLLGLIALAILAASWHAIAAAAVHGTAVAIVIFVVIGLVTGHLLGPRPAEDRVVLALSCASRHPGIAMALGTASFPQAGGVGVTILLYLVISTVVSMIYLKVRPALAAAPKAN